MLRAGLIRSGAVALAAAVTLAALLAACGDSTGDESGNGGPAALQPRAPDVQSNDSLGVTTESQLHSAGGAGGGTGSNPSLPSVTDRKIIRTATLELSVKGVGAAVQEISDIATTAGGFVSGSSVFVDQSSKERTQTGTVTIRVPAAAFQSVMSQLRGAAEEVLSETSDASEVTEEYTDLQSRLRNLHAVEQQYIELLGKAEAIPDILTVQDRLNSVRSEIEQVQGRINVLNDLTDLATITVKLSLPAPPSEEETQQGWAAKAWETSWETSKDAMVVLGTVAIGGGVLLAWLAAPALVAFIVWRRFGRRLTQGAKALASPNPAGPTAADEP